MIKIAIIAEKKLRIRDFVLKYAEETINAVFQD
jgi:hypothetical protein